MKHEIRELGCLSQIERVSIQEQINTTGCEVSINNLKNGTCSKFLHSHKRNEEVIIVTKGEGLVYLNGEEKMIQEGTILRIDPTVVRGFKSNENLQFICIQTEKDSLVQHTFNDGILSKDRASWT